VEIQGNNASVGNEKSIETTESGAHGIMLTGDDGRLTNHAGSDITTGFGSAIFLDGIDGTITNDGTLTTGVAPGASDADGIHAIGPGAPDIINNQTITTFGTDSDGISVNAPAGSAFISNSGDITTADNNADGIELNGRAEYTVSSTGNIVTTGLNAHGVALYRGSSLNFDATISNAGNIIVSGSGSAAMRLATQAGDSSTVTNSATGTLTGPVYAIDGGLGDETVRNFGTINGDIYLAAGDDTFVRGPNSTVNGDIYGGTETSQDTLQFALSGSESISGVQYVDFEVLAFSGTGSLTLMDDLYVTTAYITAGTTFTLDAGSVLDVTTVTVDTDGTLSGNGVVTGSVDANGGRLATGSSIGALTIDGDLSLNGGTLEFEADSVLDTDQLWVGGDVTLADGTVEVILGYTPAPQDILEFLTIAGTLDIQPGFDGITGVAAAGSGVALGTQFTVDLGGQLFQGTVTSVVPVPPALYLFGSGLLGLIGIARRKAAA